VSRILECVSLSQTCAEVEAVIARARSLFGPGQAVDVPETSGHISSAAQSVSAARARTDDLSGVAVRSYQAMADGSVPPLTSAAVSDGRLAGHLVTAAAVQQAGASRLDQIAASTREISKIAPMAKSRASQQAVLAALKVQVAQASQVVSSTQQQAAALSAQVRGLEYPMDVQPTGIITNPDPVLEEDLPGAGTDSTGPRIPDSIIKPTGLITNPDPVLQQDLPGAGTDSTGPRIPDSIIKPKPRNL